MTVGAQPLHDREPVAVGEHDVEHHEVGAECRRRLQGVGAGAGDLDVEAFVAQGGRDQVGDVRLVVDDEDSCISHLFMVAPWLCECCARPEQVGRRLLGPRFRAPRPIPGVMSDTGVPERSGGDSA